MFRRFLTCFVPLVLLTRALSAQAASGSVDLGAAFLTQPTIGSSSVLTAAAAYTYASDRVAFTANALGARTPNNLYTGQGVVTASRYAPATQRARWELSATATGFGVSGVAPAFGGSVLARGYLGSSDDGGFAGISAGAVGQSGAWWRLAGAHAGGYLRLDGAGTDELSGAVVFTNAKPPAAAGPAIRYGDLLGYWQHDRGPLELLIGGGARASATRSLGSTGWVSGTATLWMTSRLALVFSAGRALEDVTRAIPSVRYLSLALRVGQQRSTDLLPTAIHRGNPDHEEGRLEVRASRDSMRLVTVRADTAAAVELMADFTDWEPVAMVKGLDGIWSLERPITPGAHHVAIRIDGGAWRAPPNLARVPDDFGGEVGLLAVP